MSKRSIAIIAGTGLAASLAKSLERVTFHSNLDVNFQGRHGSIISYVEGSFNDLRVVILPRHGPTVSVPDRSPAELVRLSGHEAHIWHFFETGIKRVYAFNSVGSVDHSVDLAQNNAFLIPDQFARGLGAVSHSFGSAALDIHPSMAQPFSQSMREILIRATHQAGAIAIDHGLYIHSAGDAFESPPEVDAYRNIFSGWPNKVVGMTSGAEIVLCKQMRMEFALICASCNWAQGIEGPPVTHEHVLEGMRPATDTLEQIARHVIAFEAEHIDQGYTA
ncbi:hypothetical protein [Sphingomonas sanguinis]|uniref:phosphorylase family protein n=1 Tax=Sphingomonas sanguinis TaxID=33051 RepID=UPI000AF8D8CC|nr:hypothetical protein [Sphingomonas sanguinis]